MLVDCIYRLTDKYEQIQYKGGLFCQQELQWVKTIGYNT